jgi:4-hydroxy-3-polyprenylbenzoate decarboxylase
MKMQKQGKKKAAIAVVNGVDPITFTLGASKLAKLGEDELEYVGGLRGKPVEMVKCETSEILVPAHSEIVLEGEIPLGEMEEEGPYGEMYGFMGLKKNQNFFMNINAVTHRNNPWIVNSFAGVTKISPSILQTVINSIDYKESIPNLLDIYRPAESTGVLLASIDKQHAGEGMSAGRILAEKDFFGKVIIVVDKDVDVHDKAEIFQALGTRWQPNPAAEIVEETKGMPLDASAPKRFFTSKIIIDATRQFSDEGGPAIWPEISKVMLQELSPDTFDLIEKNWESYFSDWKP